MDTIQITKASGEKANFSDQKLRRSMNRSGADEKVIEEIVKEVESHLYEGMTTKKIYQLAFKLLKKKQKSAASKYKLKNAILEMGPSGFPFEKYVAELFKFQGYTVRVNQIMKGRCVDHEVDVMAERDRTMKIMECKFHNSQGTICDVKVPLYVHSRFKDISVLLDDNKKYEGWVVTNTRFSTDAVLYANCSGLQLLGWDFPDRQGLRDLIDQSSLYPITCLTTLTSKEKAAIMDAGLLVCKNLWERKNILDDLKISPERIEGILHEAKGLSATPLETSIAN
jgi:Restriction endonuclease